MGVLTVQIYKRCALLCQIANRSQTSVDISARSTIKRNNSSQHNLNVFVDKPAFDSRLTSTRSNDARVCTTTHKQTYGFDQHCLASTCLAS